MAEVVYVLCALTSAGCAALLLRTYFANRSRLLLWSSLCFVGLALNNLLLFVDLVLTDKTIDLSLFRNLISVVSIGTLLFGLIWESR